MTENTADRPDPDEHDQDSEPASQPSGAAAAESDPGTDPEEADQDAGPASEPDA